MHGPLSLKQHREETLLNDRLLRDENKHTAEERRKDQLHQIKLQEAAAKANQGLGHKDETHKVKLQDMRAPLARKPSLRSTNTDTVPAMLTPGEAVIPRAAAQDPRNKEAIRRMVGEGRRGYQDGTVGVPDMQGFDEEAWRASEEERRRLLEEQAIAARGADARAAYEAERSSGIMETPVAPPPTPTAVPPVTNTGYTAADRAKFENKSFFISPFSKPEDRSIPKTTVPSELGSDKPSKYVYAVDPIMLESQFFVESGGKHLNDKNQLITSKKGARGISQIMPETGKNPGFGVRSLQNETEEEYRRFGHDYQQALLQRYDGNNDKALTAYNAGAGNVDKAIEKANAAGKPETWKSFLPTTEAKEYADKVNAEYDKRSKSPHLSSGEKTRPLSAMDQKKFDNLTKALSDPSLSESNRIKFQRDLDSLKVQQRIGPIDQVRKEVLSEPKQNEIPTAPSPYGPPPPAYDDKVNGVPKTKEQLELEANIMTLPSEAEIAKRDYDISQRAQEKQADLNAALTKIKEGYPPEKQEAALSDTIKGFFKDLFTGKELARFALVAAGGMLTGGSAGGSLRFAAKDTLTAMDRRVAEESVTTRQEKHDERLASKEERNKLIELGYEPKKIDAYQLAKKGGFKPDIQRDTRDLNKYIESGMPIEDATKKVIEGRSDNTSILGDPIVRSRDTGHAPVNLVVEGGRHRGSVLVMREEQVHQGNKDMGKRRYTILDGKKVYENDLPSILGRVSITRPYVEGDTAKGKSEAMRIYGKDLEGDAKQRLGFFKGKVGDKDPALLRMPTEAAIGNSAIDAFSKFGLHSDKPEDRAAMNEIFSIGLERMIAEHRSDSKSKIEDFRQYINEAIIKQRSGLEGSSFLNKDNKPMTANHLTSLHTALSNKIRSQSDTELDPRVVLDKVHEKLGSLHSKYVAQTEEGRRLRDRFTASDDVSGFFRYATDQLK